MYSKEKILISLIGFTFLMVLMGNVNVAESATLVVDNVNPSSNCVDGGSAYQTIQSAVAGAGEGGTIIVCPGIYTENVYVHVCNRLTINSFSGDPSDTIVRAANPSYPVFYFSDSYCVEPYPSALAKVISGFTITGSNYVSGVAGIHVYCAKYGAISNNYISGNGSGIYMVDTYEFWDFYWNMQNPAHLEHQILRKSNTQSCGARTANPGRPEHFFKANRIQCSSKSGFQPLF